MLKIDSDFKSRYQWNELTCNLNIFLRVESVSAQLGKKKI